MIGCGGRGAIYLETSVCALHLFSTEGKQQLRKCVWGLMLDVEVHSSAKSRLFETEHPGLPYVRTAGSAGEQEGGALRGPGEWHLARLAASFSPCCTPQASGSLSHNWNPLGEEGLWMSL